MHHDTHDVFCLQVEGEKRWLVYPPVLELPLKQQKYAPEMGGPGEPVLDVTLRAGDMLYLPRGWLHQAMTSDTASLHLTVGVNVFTWRDAVREALDEAAREDVELRRGVRPTARRRGAARRARGEAHARSGLDPAAAVVRRVAPPDPRTTRSTSCARSTSSTLDTPLERRRTVIADLVGRGRAAGSRSRAASLPCRPFVADDLELILEADEPFRAERPPGPLDDSGRLVLVRRLVREGLLRIRPD